MARRYYSSIAARTTLSSSITSSAVTMGVVAVSGWPSSFPYTLIIDSDLATEEIVTVTGRSGLTVTITRGVDGTTGQAHDAGSPVQHGVSARDFDEPNTHDNTAVKHVTVVTSSSRPASPSAGEIIYETDTTLYFGWNGSAWTGIGGSSGGAGLQDVFFLMGA